MITFKYAIAFLFYCLKESISFFFKTKTTPKPKTKI